jgi:hypothetical protein
MRRAADPMDLFINSGSSRGLIAQLYDQVRVPIADGRLRPGDQLPPSRHLALRNSGAAPAVAPLSATPQHPGWLVRVIRYQR